MARKAVPIALGGAILLAFLIRVLPQWGNVFDGGMVSFQEVDPWYHIRLAEGMSHNGLSPIRWDMFGAYMGGLNVGFFPLMTWLIVIPSYIISWGTPSSHTVGVVGALIPPILGSLILIPIYIIGRELKNKTVGLIAAGLVAVLPTELLHRSMLGFTDHHILEVFFAAFTVMFLILAVKKPKYLYIAGAGISLGLYLSAWWGGIMLPFIIGLWFLAEFFLRMYRKREVVSLCKIVSLSSLIALLVALPAFRYSPDMQLEVVTSLVLVIAPWGLYLATRLIDWRGVMAVLIPSGTAFFFLAIFTSFNVRGKFESVFWTWGSTITEAQPTYPDTAIAYYGLCALLFLGGLYYFVRQRGEKNLLFLVWTFVVCFAAISQRKWGYYCTISVALMSAYLLPIIWERLKKDIRVPAMAMLCFIVLIPCCVKTADVTTNSLDYTDDWRTAMTWMRDNTPEPFQNPNAYYETRSWGEYPSYGVICWWDYGHWVTQVAHRVPSVSPSWQYVGAVAPFYTAQTEQDAIDCLKRAGDIKYVIITEEMISDDEDKTIFGTMVGLSGLPDIVLSQWKELLPDSQALRIWKGKAIGYTLVCDTETVKIFEVAEWLYDFDP